MKTKLLRKLRSRVTLVNPHGEKAAPNSKFISIKVKLPFQKEMLYKSTENKYYGYYGAALTRREKIIRELVHNLRKSPKWLLIFY